MNQVKNYFLSIWALCSVSFFQAQEYSIQDLEHQFVTKNTQIIAQKYNLDIADAEIIQAKFLSNPTLRISEVNLWKTYRVEEQPNLFSNYGRNQQVAVELEQLIETAGKRKKRVALKEAEKNAAILEYQEMILELKKELRTQYWRLNRIAQQEVSLQETISVFEELKNQYQRQSQLQNVSRADFYRVQTELSQLQKEWISLQNEKAQVLTTLRVLTNIESLETNQIKFPVETRLYSSLVPLDLKQTALSQNMDLLQNDNQSVVAKKNWELEYAARVPDLAFSMNYDRGGNIMRDFVGFGVQMDLPVFNKNKGDIKAAEYKMQQEKANRNVLEFNLLRSIDHLIEQLNRLESSMKNEDRIQESEHRKMIETYRRQMQNKQVTMLEFIDYTQAFRESQKASYEIQELYNLTYEELQYITGKDF